MKYLFFILTLFFTYNLNAQVYSDRGAIPLNIRTAEDVDPIRSFVNKFGSLSAVDVVDAPLDVWDGERLYPGQPLNFTAETVEVFSNDADDASGGTGARTIVIFGLDSLGLQQSDTITLNGTTAVSTTNKYKRVFRGIITSAGSSGHNEGVISCRSTTTTANVFFEMRVEANQTQVMAYTVPSDKDLYITNIVATLGRDNGADGSARIAILIRDKSGVYRQVPPLTITNGSPVHLEYPIPLRLMGDTDILVRALSISDNNTSLDVMYNGYLKDN